MKKILFLICFIIFSPSVVAYIPAYSMILSQLAYFNGRGDYRIEQELFFKQSLDSFSLTETWWIKSSGEMRLDVSSRKKELKDLYLRFIYSRNMKRFRDENNKIQKRTLSPYHLERPFHLRSVSRLHGLFSLWKVAPLQIPEREPAQGSDYFVHLSRKGGMVQYQIGKGTPGLWIQQDEFVIHSWKWLSGESLVAWDYQLYPGHLFFPSQRKFHQATREVLIRVKKVQSLKVNKKLLRINQLSQKNKLPEKLSSGNRDRIREFYEKFR